jgi:hypothetical protein
MNKTICIIIFMVLIVSIIYYLYNRKSSKQNKIAVCTWYDDNIKEYADLTSAINKKYCDNNNYDYIVDHTRRLPERDHTWECITLLKKLLNKYDYVVWIDADACFRYDYSNQNLLKDIIHKNKDKDIILSKDAWETDTNICNCGFMIFKNSKYSNNLLHNIINSNIPQCKLYKDVFHEQTCISHLYINNINRLKEKSIILPFGLLQTFNIDENKDSLIIHLAGQSKEIRIETFKKLKENYKI